MRKIKSEKHVPKLPPVESKRATKSDSEPELQFESSNAQLNRSLRAVEQFMAAHYAIYGFYFQLEYYQNFFKQKPNVRLKDPMEHQRNLDAFSTSLKPDHLSTTVLSTLTNKENMLACVENLIHLASSVKDEDIEKIFQCKTPIKDGKPNIRVQYAKEYIENFFCTDDKKFKKKLIAAKRKTLTENLKHLRNLLDNLKRFAQNEAQISEKGGQIKNKFKFKLPESLNSKELNDSRFKADTGVELIRILFNQVKSIVNNLMLKIDKLKINELPDYDPTGGSYPANSLSSLLRDLSKRSELNNLVLIYGEDIQGLENEVDNIESNINMLLPGYLNFLKQSADVDLLDKRLEGYDVRTFQTYNLSKHLIDFHVKASPKTKEDLANIPLESHADWIEEVIDDLLNGIVSSNDRATLGFAIDTINQSLKKLQDLKHILDNIQTAKQYCTHFNQLKETEKARSEIKAPNFFARAWTNIKYGFKYIWHGIKNHPYRTAAIIFTAAVIAFFTGGIGLLAGAIAGAAAKATVGVVVAKAASALAVKGVSGTVVGISSGSAPLVLGEGAKFAYDKRMKTVKKKQIELHRRGTISTLNRLETFKTLPGVPAQQPVSQQKNASQANSAKKPVTPVPQLVDLVRPRTKSKDTFMHNGKFNGVAISSNTKLPHTIQESKPVSRVPAFKTSRED